MTYDALTKFLGKPVLVTYMDEIELDAGTFCYGIPLDEITDMTELS